MGPTGRKNLFVSMGKESYVYDGFKTAQLRLQLSNCDWTSVMA